MVGEPDERRGEQRGLFATDPAAAEAAVLDGTLARIVYRHPDSGFTVARIHTTDGGEATAVGELWGLPEGTPLRLRGQWVDDRRFGRQLKVAGYQVRSPETLVGIEKFLGGGIIPGIGPELARRMVARFGPRTLEVVEREPERLTEVEGIGAGRAAKISAAFAEHRHVQDVMVFLRGHGVSAAFAGRIVRRYGKDAVRVVRDNPYRLAAEVWGIGFRTADAIAEKLGLARDAPERLRAGLVHVLGEQVEDGHTHVPEDALLDRGAELLAVARDKLAPALDALERGGTVTREVLGDRGRTAALAAVTELEVEAAAAFAELCRTPAGHVTLDVEQAVAEVEAQADLQLAPQQRAAVVAAAVDKCVVVTGGPGVGKTTIIRAVVGLAARMRRRCALAAPTGRAAKRLAEATGREALTLHRLLEYSPQSGEFQRDRDHPLELDLLVVDECSMVDLALFRALVVALPPRTQLVLVGDVDQLPSVGAGAVLADVIASGAATVVRLTEIFRQAAASRIVTSAHQINHGVVPELETAAGAASDFYFVGRDEAAAARDTVVELVTERIPARFGLDPLADVQVLAPMHRGELGTAALNAALQARLNPPADDRPELARGERTFRQGDKVMQLKNDYDRNVYNGDIGVVERVDKDAGRLRVALGDGRVAEYERSDLDQLVLAYAVSIHKSQGSEYPAVVIPLATQHYMMLGRSLLYTAVTRGKRLVVIVGSRRAVSMAVRNATARARFTWLAERIRDAVASGPAELDGADGPVDLDDVEL
ncbi:MAG: ATP-dependent RecD-like DNA helicase [Kofleriaceae bacterium]|nr:ATP-dependent RecD-like DNA helicase [Kofleriaceae bacterium]MCL4227353.1 ATP-dependent RecD-like DNA helicase [Myxococcales bacterium]